MENKVWTCNCVGLILRAMYLYILLCTVVKSAICWQIHVLLAGGGDSIATRFISVLITLFYVYSKKKENCENDMTTLTLILHTNVFVPVDKSDSPYRQLAHCINSCSSRCLHEDLLWVKRWREKKGIFLYIKTKQKSTRIVN